jgi:hypothetical protein
MDYGLENFFLNVNFRLFFWSLFTSLRILGVFIQNSRQPFSMRRDKKTTYAEEREYKRFPFTLSTLTEAETEDKVIKVKRGQKGVNQEACLVSKTFFGN